MGRRVELPIANGFYVSDSLPISNQQCVNWYVNIPQSDSLSKANLFGTPGYSQIASTGVLDQINRGSHVKNGVPYFVNGEALYRLDRTIVEEEEIFSLVSLGVIPGEGRVSMADNGTQLIILVPGGDGFIYNEDEGVPFQQIADPAFTDENTQLVVFIDSYFAVTTDSKKWIVSAPNDGLSWNALDFGTAEADPDNIVAPVVHQNQIFIMGSETAEPFQNIGGSGFPFQRVPGGVLDKGCFAPFTLINANNTFMFIGGGTNESPAIWQFAGNGFQKVSTTAIDSILQGYTEAQISNSFAYQYAQKGAYFVAFSLPDTTLVIDTVTGRWHERKSQIKDAKGFTQTVRSRVNSLITAYSRVLVGDSQDGRIGVMDTDTYDEYGEEIIRTASTQPFAQLGERVFYPMLELTMESGVGDSDTPNPQIRLSISEDGKSFAHERSRSIGKIGEFKHRVIWRRNGRAPRLAVFKFVMSDKVKPVIIKLEAEIK